jgi:hypothetical protein
MTRAAASSALQAASADLEAIRPQADMAIGSTKAEDAPILGAWTLALKRFREACAAYVEASA